MGVNSQIENIKFDSKSMDSWWQLQKRTEMAYEKGRTPNREFLEIMEFADKWGRLMQAKMGDYYDPFLLTKDIVHNSMKEMINYWAWKLDGNDEKKQQVCKTAKELIATFWRHGQKFSSFFDDMKSREVAAWRHKVWENNKTLLLHKITTTRNYDD